MYDFLTLLAVLGFGALIYKYFKDQAKFKARYKTLLENPRTIIGKPKSRRFDMDSFPIVGESFHQGNIRKIVEEDDEYAEIEFVHEPNNLHDENGMAIAVVSQHGTIGHLAQGSRNRNLFTTCFRTATITNAKPKFTAAQKPNPLTVFGYL